MEMPSITIELNETAQNSHAVFECIADLCKRCRLAETSPTVSIILDMQKMLRCSLRTATALAATIRLLVKRHGPCVQIKLPTIQGEQAPLSIKELFKAADHGEPGPQRVLAILRFLRSFEWFGATDEARVELLPYGASDLRHIRPYGQGRPRLPGETTDPHARSEVVFDLLSGRFSTL
jgi:hypothetical protein